MGALFSGLWGGGGGNSPRSQNVKSVEVCDNYNDTNTPKQSSYARDGCSKVSIWIVDGWLGLD